ncbi:type I-E CRISPR-associated protein Cse1/CasA [Glutamicibacter endophyticus]
MTPENITFNLLDERWIPCAMLDGTTRNLTLTEIFKDARSIARVVGDDPLQSAAILRTLLVILWRAQLTRGELQDADPDIWWEDRLLKHDDGEVFDLAMDYLDYWRPRFDLLDSAVPFMQVADLRKPDESIPDVDRLMPDSESDYFALRAGPGKQSLTFAEAARALITIHAYDYAGIKPGTVGDPRLKGGKSYPIGPGWAGWTGVAIIHGHDLAETLLYNTPAEFILEHSDAEQDLPAWEREAHTSMPRHETDMMPDGPCDLLTWQARRVRLHWSAGEVTGALVTNGDKVIFKNQFEDPMTAYRYSKNQSSKTATVHMPRDLDPSLTVWKGLEALLTREDVRRSTAKDQPADIPPETVSWLRGFQGDRNLVGKQVVVELIGVQYGAQMSSITNTISSKIPLQLGTLMDDSALRHKDLVDVIEQTEKAATALGQFGGNLKDATGDRYEFDANLKESLLQDLSAQFTNWIASIDHESSVEGKRREWEGLVREATLTSARRLVRSSSPQTLIGKIRDTRVVSAATAYELLSSVLNKLLPLTRPAKQSLQTTDPEGVTA